MRTPRWVRDDVVLAIHDRLLAEHGGAEGVRDSGLLESALNRPKFAFKYTKPKPDLAALAAAYAFGIIRNHPFHDGNKRVGYTVCRTFLILNGREITATQADKYLTFLKVAEGNLTEDQLAEWVRKRIKTAD